MVLPESGFRGSIVATIKEVSRLANVSMATVSRVLTGSAPVASATRERVLAAVRELGYTPNAFARSLATDRSGGIGVVVNDLGSLYFGAMLHGIEEVVEAAGMHLVVSGGHAKAASEKRAVDFLRQRRCDALILRVEETSDDDLIAWSQDKAPVVVVGRSIAELGKCSVYLDNEMGGELATRYLVEQGHTRIAHVSGPLSLHDSRERLVGYRRALEAAGIVYDKRFVVEGNFLEEGGKQAMRRLLGRDLDFTAVFVGNDQMAAGALLALREAELEVPKDVSIVGYDDILIARYLYPALTTVRQPLREMGEAAARLALAALGKLDFPLEEVTRRFEPSLVIRESVASPSSGKS
jgi:LacI family transcriptional regulator